MLAAANIVVATITGSLLLLSAVKASQVDISGWVGSTVRLPCHVDTKTCGNLHSIKWYRGSSRIFVFSDLAKFSKSEGEYEHRARLVNDQSDTTFFLEVNNIRDNDEAVYKCEITYLNVVETCLVVQFINLTTLVAPNSLRIVDDAGKEIKRGSSIGPYQEDSSVTLTCEVGVGKPVPLLQWFRNNQKIDGTYMPESGSETARAATNKIQFKVSRSDLGAIYECRASSQALNETMVTNVEILANVKPSKMELSGFDKPVEQNSTVVLHCAVFHARPAATVTWYNGSARLDEADNSISKNFTPMPDGTINTISRLTFTATRYEHLKTFRCIAHNEVMKEKDLPHFEKEVHIQVHYAPIISLVPTEIMVNETADVYLNCTYEANPYSLLQRFWYFNGGLLPKNITYEIRDNTLILKRVNRDFLGRYSCGLRNTVGAKNSSEVEVNVLFPPIVRVEADNATTVNESTGTNVSLICRVVRGNPWNLSSVRWYFDNVLMYRYPNVSNLYLENVNKAHHGNYSCSGKTEAGWGPRSNPIEVIVQYPPGDANISYHVEYPNGTAYFKSMITKGLVVSLKCLVANLGRPLDVTYHWYEGNNEVFVKDARRNELKLSNVGVKEKLSNYSCNAQNAAGFGKNATVRLNIGAPPAFINTKNYVYVAKTDKVATMRCEIECDPLCEVSWFRNGKMLENDDVYQIENINVPENLDKNDFKSVTSTLRLNLTNLPLGHAEPNRDDAEYVCESTSNSIGDKVSTKIEFNVHFAPVNVTTYYDVLNISDNRIPPRITCMAEGRPKPNFRWYSDGANVTVSSDAFLSFNAPLSREGSTNFTCEAYNDYGSSTKTIFFNILYKPICNIRILKNDGKKRLLCEAIGNPRPHFYNWTADEIDSSNIQVDERGSFLDIEATSEKRVFNCTATNIINTSDPCTIEVPASDSWWHRFLFRGEDVSLFYVIITAAIILIVLVICVLIIFICRKRRAKEKYCNRIDLPSRQNFDGNNLDGPPPAPVIPKWPLKPGVLVHVNNNHSLNARRLQSVTNINVNTATVQPQNQFYSVAEKCTKREQFKYKTDTLPGVFHGKSGVVSFKKFDNTVVPATNPRKRKKPGSGATDLGGKNKNSYHSPNDALLQPDNDKTFYENLPFHGMQNPPNKLDSDDAKTRPPSVQSQYDGSSGYGSTRSHVTNSVERTKVKAEDKDTTEGKFNSYRPRRAKRNWPQFRSLRASKKNKIPMLPIKENSPEAKGNNNEGPKVLPKPVPAPRKVIGFSFNKPSAKHTYQNVPIPITPNKISPPTQTTTATATVTATTTVTAPKQATSHLTNSSPMEYFRLTPTANTRPYNGSISTNVSLKKYKISSNNSGHSPSLSRGGPPTVPRHHSSSFPSTHQLNNGLVYADLTVSRHKKKHHRPSAISNAQTYPYHTEYAVIKFHDVGREIDV